MVGPGWYGLASLMSSARSTICWGAEVTRPGVSHYLLRIFTWRRQGIERTEACKVSWFGFGIGKLLFPEHSMLQSKYHSGNNINMLRKGAEKSFSRRCAAKKCKDLKSLAINLSQIKTGKLRFVVWMSNGKLFHSSKFRRKAKSELSFDINMWARKFN